MNFLSHYYLLENKQNPDQVLGNLIPDLMRGFTKIYNKKIKNNNDFIENDLIKGINFHLKTDKIFHQHPYFIEKNKLIKNYIFDLKLPSHKYYLTTHILSELIIDQYLINTQPELGIQFYQSLRISLKKSFTNKLNSILDLNDNSKILLNFKSFIKKEYAFELSKTQGIQFAMNQIIGHKIGIDFKKNNWAQLIEQSSKDFEKDMPFFLTNINLALKNA